MTHHSVSGSLKYISALSAFSESLHFPICYTKDIFAHLMRFNLCLPIFVLLMICSVPPASAQDVLPDVSGRRVVAPKSMDSLFTVQQKPSVYGEYTGGILSSDNIFNASANAPKIPVLIRKVDDRDWVFYLYCGLLLFLCFIQLAFDRYFIDLFRVFFNTSLRQKQIREQLSQAPLPSLLLNILFFISGGIFLSFLLERYSFQTGYAKPVEILLAIGGIALVYAVKFIFLTLLGWMFDKREVSESYLFNVFMVNKIAGLVLIPLGILLAYSSAGWKDVVITLTGIFVAVLVVLRMIRCYNAISYPLRINPLHFLVFTGAFEVIPLLVLYRLFLRVIE